MAPRGQKAQATTAEAVPAVRSTRAARSESKDLDEAVAGTRASKRLASTDTDGAAGQNKRARVTQSKKTHIATVEEVDEDEDENEVAAAILNQIATGTPAKLPAKGKGKGKAKVGGTPPSNQQQLQEEATSSAPTAGRRKSRNALPAEPTGGSYYNTANSEAQESVNEQVLAELLIKSEKERNKENRPLPTESPMAKARRRKFIERQAGATRVSQISDDVEEAAQEYLEVEGTEQSRSGDENEIPAVPKAKAGRAKNVTQIGRGDKRRQAPSRLMPQAQMTAAAEQEDSQDVDDAAAAARARFNARMKAEADSPASSTPATPARLDSLAPIDSSAPTPSYREIQQRAKERTALLRKAPQQKRRFWVEDEEAELIRLIEERGCAWAEFEKEGAFNKWGGRNQGQLKDKAMNIRFDLEKSGYPVTGHFLNISLRKAMREELERLRQKELEELEAAENPEDEGEAQDEGQEVEA